MLRSHAKPAEIVPNLAPMVDVIMVLLIFFLLGTSLEIVRHGVLETELDPRVGPGEGVAVELKPRIRIGLTDIGGGAAVAIHVLDEPIGENDFAGLAQYLRLRREAGADAENPIVIGAETDVRWQFVVSAMDAVVRAGFRNVQFAVSFRRSAAP